MDKRALDVELRGGVQRLLGAGVALSGSLLASGLVLDALGASGARAALRAGLIALMCTPVARVAALAAGYARARDWPFFWAAVGVLALLGVGVLL